MRRRHLESVSVRSTDDAFASFVSSTASDRKGFVKGESVPLDRILVPFVRTKGTPPRRAVFTMPLQKAPRRRQARRNYYLLLSIPQSALRLTASRCGSVTARLCYATGISEPRRHFVTPYTREPLGWGGATPLAQGSLWGGVTAGWLLEYHITVITLSKNDMSKKRFFCVTHN